MSFERFCELVAKDTSLNYMEVQSVLNFAADMAREVVANGGYRGLRPSGGAFAFVQEQGRARRERI